MNPSGGHIIIIPVLVVGRYGVGRHSDRRNQPGEGRKVDGANFMISLAVRENKSDKGESG